jgi:fatty acid desaturase
MNTQNAQHVFPVFFVIWALLGVGGALFFYGNRDASLKRKLWPCFIVLVGLLFLGFTWSLLGSIPLPFVVLIPVIMFINIRMTRFCDSCGRTVVSRNLFAPAKFCQGCGAELKP